LATQLAANSVLEASNAATVCTSWRHETAGSSCSAGAAPPPINVTESDDFIVTGIGKHRLVIDQAMTPMTATPGVAASGDPV
jgi:hypothetical protein